ncbi:hypothetical protein DNL40_01845 [Xylanimonas oleitrophica]|uniref:DUF4349 domain-containing protein n=1 Tax=Xylanimonas oleitrophica TaxID=2607479 RepID=A0A2W5X2M9_9MICO|nr:DUF4349 domain-containing protein [Xylanimonas oleitrophica]PZR55146.1 hypothetical protein DNL40_01845 [Xylanimonas oleitrophica]
MSTPRTAPTGSTRAAARPREAAARASAALLLAVSLVTVTAACGAPPHGAAESLAGDHVAPGGAVVQHHASAGAPDAAAAGTADTAETPATGAAAPEAAEGTGPEGAVHGTAEETAREVITRGTASVVSADPAAAAQRLSVLTEEAGGHVESREERRGSPSTAPSATLVLRLPADHVSRTVDALADLGEVADVSVTREDVTATGRDLDARVAALTTSTDRLRELMVQAADTADLLRVEKELSDRQAELDALRSRRASLSEQVAMSTLEVWITADASALAATAPPPPGFLGGLSAGWEALVVAGRWALVVVGTLLPWAAAAGVLLAVGRLGWRALLEVRARRSGSAPAPTAP